MTDFLQTSWPILVVALLLLAALAWYIFHARRTTRVASDRRDVLDEGAERAHRNQALLDAPPRPVTSATDPGLRTTASMPLPGAVGGAETAAGSLGGMSAAIAASEQAERDALLGEAPDGAENAAVAPPPSPPARGGAGEGELTQLKGVGPRLAQQLRELGVDRIDQVAAWTDADIDRIDAALGRFQGRIRRDDWVGQARLLTSGERAAYEDRFGKLDPPGT